MWPRVSANMYEKTVAVRRTETASWGEICPLTTSCDCGEANGHTFLAPFALGKQETTGKKKKKEAEIVARERYLLSS